MIHDLANLDAGVKIDPTANVWRFATLRENCEIGPRTTVGQGAYIGPGVKIGSDVKVQNHALIYEPSEIADGVFIGPGVIVTNDHNPRAVFGNGTQKSHGDWTVSKVTISLGASIGAGSVLVAPLAIGEWAMVGAGSVVTRDVPAHALFVGSPAKQVGWVGKSGFRLEYSRNRWVCPVSGEEFHEFDPPTL